MTKKTTLALVGLLTGTLCFAQPDEPSLLDALGPEEATTEVEHAIFKTNRVINAHSLENTAGGVMDMKIQHRFGYVDQGLYNLFGFDQASVRIGLDYGVTDRLQVGFGFNSYQKTWDIYGKYRVLWQTTKGSAKKMPINLSIVSAMAVVGERFPASEPKNSFSQRLTYTNQLLLGRKFSESFSLQLMPTLLYRNLVDTKAESNMSFLMGIAARQKLTKRTSINAEYFYGAASDYRNFRQNSLSLGFDIETGGHVFQVFFSNSLHIVERGYLADTSGDWLKGQFLYGFNISRVFTIVQPEKVWKF